MINKPDFVATPTLTDPRLAEPLLAEHATVPRVAPESAKRQAYLTREAILALLTDEENAQVSTAETASALLEGDEYIDLTHFERGVQTSDGVAATMGHVLPRKSVQGATWAKLVARLTHID
jgi:hypothetical protein